MKLPVQKAIALLNTKKPNPDKAITALKPVLKNKKAPWVAFHYMGVALLQKREHEKAVTYLKEALERGSDEPETWHLLSVAHLELEQLDEAESNAKEALKRKSDFFKGWLNLGSVYRAQARLEEALRCFQKANQLDPRSAGVAFRIASVYRDQGDIQNALKLYDIAIKIDGEYFQAMIEKSHLLHKIKKFPEAKAVLEEILEKSPKNLDARMALAEIDRTTGNYAEAISLFEEILSEYPTIGAVRVNYALALQEIGRFNESEKNYIRVFNEHPESVESLSNYLMGMHYNPERTREEMFEAHLKWDENFSPKERPSRPDPQNNDPDRKLRIGLISGGFWRHPVGWMITAALENLPKDQFEIYCYTSNNLSDELTRRIHAVSDSWKSVVGYGDGVIAGMIRVDKIDILVELSGHSADNRLKTVVQEPAPVIVKWVGGLFNTTGLRAVDFLLTDWHETPAGVEDFYTEKLVRMPDDYICFLPPDYAPETGELPAAEKGYITFGCFNNPTKVNSVLLEKWAEIMNQVPDSRLILKSKQYDSEIFTRRIVEQMEGLGITADRLQFEGHSSHPDLLEKYNEVDIALDPWPYSGGLSTCEALWMGVPVITLPGPTFAGRHSATHLVNAGFPELVVDSWDSYIGKAVALASDTGALAELRSEMREQVWLSPLCDGERFGAHLSRAFREMWKQRLAGWKSGADDWRDHIAVEAVQEVTVAKRSGEAHQKDSSASSPKALNASTDVSSGELSDVADNKSPIVADAGTTDSVDNESEAEALRNSNNGNATKSNGQDENRQKSESATATNGSADNGNGQMKTWKIETKDDVVICTPADLNILTPYVLLEQEQWYEPELQFVRDYLTPGMNVVDVGAGFGVYAVPMAKKVGPEGKVYAFDPESVPRKHLEMSKLENATENVEIIGRAVAAKSGERDASFGEGKENNITTVTLDDWWEYEGRPNLSFLKIDTAGTEREVLKGAKSLLSETAPIVMFARPENKTIVSEVQKQLGHLGYALFEYVPGSGVLVPGDPEVFDPYLQNLFAVKSDVTKKLRDTGWIHQDQGETRNVKSGIWETYLAMLPWSENQMEAWRAQSRKEEHKTFFKALDYLCSVYIDDDSPTVKTDLLLDSAKILIGLYHAGKTDTAISMTLARVLHSLGKRVQAADVIMKLLQTSKMGKGLSADLPFLPPIQDFDGQKVRSRFDNWMMVKLIESWLLLKDLSGFQSGEQEKKLLAALRGNPDCYIVYQHILADRRASVSGGDAIENSLLPAKNTWFWKNDPQGSFDGIVLSDDDKQMDKTRKLEHIYFVVPGLQGGAHGLHVKFAKHVAEGVKNHGVTAEIVSASDPEFLRKVVRDSNRPGCLFYSGVMGYDMRVHADMNLNGNIFDLLGMKVIGFIGDHPYTQFMWHRIEHCAKNTVFLVSCQSVADEFQALFPGKAQVEVLENPPPMTLIASDQQLKPLSERSVDLLVPWGLHKFFMNKKTLSGQLTELGSVAKKVGLLTFEQARDDASISIYHHFQNVYQTVRKKEYVFSSDITNEDRVWLAVLSTVDWHIRMDRRVRLLKGIAKLPDDFNIMITADPKLGEFIPGFKNKKKVNWIGEVSAEKLDQLYLDSRMTLNCDPTFPDKVHERIRNAMMCGSCVISDHSPVLEETFGQRDAILFTDRDGKQLQTVMNYEDDYLQQYADKGKAIVTSEFTYENYVNRFLSIMSSHV